MIDTMLIQNPALAICGTVSSPEANTMAFGGVATGSMNTQLAASTNRNGQQQRILAQTHRQGRRQGQEGRRRGRVAGHCG